jgi:hypothetical protein
MATQTTSIAMGGGVTLTFILNEDRVTVPLKKFEGSLEDFRRFWNEYWAPEFFLHIQKNFTGEGRFVGGWRALSPAYAAWKRAHFGRKPILVATGDMKQSFVQGERNNVLNASKLRVEAGSRDRKVRYHQTGSRRMPKRQIIVVLPADLTSRLMNRYLGEEMRAAGMEKAS